MQDLIALVAGVKRRRAIAQGDKVKMAPGVPQENGSSGQAWPSVKDTEPPRPYINNLGNLVIPFSSPRKYHYWRGGQSLADTLKELESG